MGKKRIKAKHIARSAERLDVRAGKAVARFRDQPLVKQLCRLGELADQPPLFALAGATLAAGLVLGRQRLARTGLRMLAAEALATLAKGAVKHRVDRQRPHVRGGDHKVRPGRVIDEPAHNSFPSGHSAGAIAVARAIARDYPAAAGVAAGAAGVAICAQVIAAKHFPIDVAAGVAIGLAAEAGVSGLIDPPHHARKTVGDFVSPLRT